MRTKKIESFFFDYDYEIEPVYIRLRNGDENPILPEEKEELIKFADTLSDNIISNKINYEDIDLYIRILNFLGNYTTNDSVRALFDKLCNHVCIKLENENVKSSLACMSACMFSGCNSK